MAELARRGSEFRAQARDAPRPRAWLTGGERSDVAVIGEVKRRSPSAGVIAERLSPGSHARAYVAGGAVAVSVLTEERYFGGSLSDLDEVRRAVEVPLLRKDFVIDETQLCEARIHGASAVLLIARALGQGQLEDLAGAARALGLARLVEVYRASELERALAVGPEAVGINARDLETLVVNVAGIEPLLRAVPPAVLAVAESGLRERADVERVAAWGADAVLVGTAIAGAPDPENAVRLLAGVGRVGRIGRPRVGVAG